MDINNSRFHLNDNHSTYDTSIFALFIRFLMELNITSDKMILHFLLKSIFIRVNDIITNIYIVCLNSF